MGIQFQLLCSVLLSSAQLSSRKKTLAGPWAVSSDSAPALVTSLATIKKSGAVCVLVSLPPSLNSALHCVSFSLHSSVCLLACCVCVRACVCYNNHKEEITSSSIERLFGTAVRHFFYFLFVLLFLLLLMVGM